MDFSQHRAFYTKNGDLLGMTIRFSPCCTLNGFTLGTVFENIGKDCELYPSVGLRHQNESIRINLGHDPFHYDIEDHVTQQRSHVWSMIQSSAVDPTTVTRMASGHVPASNRDAPPNRAWDVMGPELSGHQDQPGKRMKGVIDGLVFDYLIHHGYGGAARAFYTQMRRSAPDQNLGPTRDIPCVNLAETEPFLDSGVDAYFLDARSKIVKSLVAGDVDGALNDTKTTFPTVLEREQGLILFKLRCRKFVELILDAADAVKRTQGRTDGTPRRIPSTPPTEAAQISLANALAYGQQLELDYKDDTRPEIAAYLKRTFSVVAYEDPLSIGGEVGRIAGQESRDTLAMEMNEAILGMSRKGIHPFLPLIIENAAEVLGKPTQPALEYVYRQTSACLVQLGLMGVGSAVFADPAKELLEP